ncbi:MAG: DUF5076 domain-containing protein [Phycisphaeraceae bacterium]|nr:DUF5076 domain-containing protein [Phycisphaeraceae bacterium]
MNNKEHPNELPIPPNALGDAKAIELLRVWAAAGHQEISLCLPDSWSDPAVWGVAIVHLIQLLGEAYEANRGDDVDQTVTRILEGFSAELQTRKHEDN